MTDRKTLDRIRKVFAKAEGTDNPHEAEMLMAKVQGMLDEHNLELLDIERASDADPIGTDMNAYHHFVKDSWWRHTVSAVARLYGAQAVYHNVTKNKTVISVSGRESARITLSLMLPFIRKQIRAQARTLAQEHGYSAAKSERLVGNALTKRVWRMVWEAEERDQNRVATGQRALVPVDLVKAEIERAYGEVSIKKSSTKTTRDAVALADKISLNRQTTGQKQAQIGVA